MAWFADLTPYTYSDVDRGALNVGWLDPDHEFLTGPPNPVFAGRLMQLCVKHRMNVTRGWQNCGFCPWDGLEKARAAGLYPIRIDFEGEDYALGDAEIRVVHSDGRIFAAPNLIAHYVLEHRYAPPAEFVAAVLADARVASEPTR
jgi:hypothetical protein